MSADTSSAFTKYSGSSNLRLERIVGLFKKGKTARLSIAFALGYISVTFWGTNRRAALKAATLSLRP